MIITVIPTKIIMYIKYNHFLQKNSTCSVKTLQFSLQETIYQDIALEIKGRLKNC